MRKSFDGLCGLISGGLGRSVTGGDVFVFLNRRRTHMKLLHWEHGGFVLYYSHFVINPPMQYESRPSTKPRSRKRGQGYS